MHSLLVADSDAGRACGTAVHHAAALAGRDRQVAWMDGEPHRMSGGVSRCLRRLRAPDTCGRGRRHSACLGACHGACIGMVIEGCGPLLRVFLFCRGRLLYGHEEKPADHGEVLVELGSLHLAGGRVLDGPERVAGEGGWYERGGEHRCGGPGQTPAGEQCPGCCLDCCVSPDDKLIGMRQRSYLPYQVQSGCGLLDGLCCVGRSQAMPRRDLGPLCWSDGGFEFVECGGQPEQRPGVDGELVVAAAEVLNEGVATDHYARRSLSPEPPHRPEPGL